ncbi:MAG: carbon-nitrogen hydrolase family protein [Syntrophomonadaceae bacterium]
MLNKISAAICQFKVGENKEKNLIKAGEMMRQAAELGAELVVLPEIFNGPYDSRLFPAFAERFPGKTTEYLMQFARQNRVFLVGGSIAEKGPDGKIYNTCYIFDQSGQLVGRHRKIHLFDIDIPDKIRFQESKTLSPGSSMTIVQHNNVSLGVMICYDVRFPELARAMALNGAHILVIPAAFNTVTGPAHWEITMRSRAVDNQVFVIAASPARNPEVSYQAWGHSMIVDPWGTILNEAAAGEEIVMAELDLSLVAKVREELPLLSHRRTDLYQWEFKK